MSNIFTRAKALRNKYPNKTWKELVQMSGTKSVSLTSNNTKMATRKKAAAPKGRKPVVSGVRTVTRTRTVKAKTRRRNVGAIVDKQMVQVAIGMALTGAVQGMIDPLKARIPQQFQKVVDPVLVVAGYMVSQKAKQPIIKGVGLGIMNNGVQGTVKTIMGFMGQRQPVQVMPPMQQPMQQPGSNMPATRMPAGMVAGDFYIPLPNSVGSFIGGIDSMIAGNEESIEQMYERANQPYIVPGWN